MTTEKIPAPGDEKYDKTKFKEEEKLDRHTLKTKRLIITNLLVLSHSCMNKHIFFHFEDYIINIYIFSQNGGMMDKDNATDRNVYSIPHPSSL